MLHERMTAFLAANADRFYLLLTEYQLWAFVGASFLKGILLFYIIPPEAVTPAYVLLTAGSLLDVAVIVVIAAGAMLAGNLFVYTVSRLLGNRLFPPPVRPSRLRRVLEWGLKRHGRVTVFLWRLIPFVGGGWIAIPAGLVRMNLRDFLLYSFLGILLYEAMWGFGAWFIIHQGMAPEVTVPFLEWTLDPAAINQSIPRQP